MLTDRFGRVHDDLRISVTDRCNLRCAYCMPQEPVWFPRGVLLTYEEILRLTRILVGNGVRKLRLTGGEPLVRRDLPRLVEMLAREPGVEDLSLTTNGVLLDVMAPDLARAGLRRINVSLDTLDPQRYRALTRRDMLARVLSGLTVAAAHGLSPIKLNVVLVRGINEGEAESMVELGRRHGWEVRFIEYMPLENDGSWHQEKVVSGQEVFERIDRRWALRSDDRPDPHAPATRFHFVDGSGSVGFINSVSRPFCGDCSRLRLTSDGALRVCLYDPQEVDLKTPLRAGASDDELAQLIRDAVLDKGRGGAVELVENRGAPRSLRTMHQIGG